MQGENCCKNRQILLFMYLIYVFPKETKEVSPIESKSIVCVCLRFSKKFSIFFRSQALVFVSTAGKFPFPYWLERLAFLKGTCSVVTKTKPFAFQ